MQHAYYVKHKNEIAEKNRIYRLQNKEKIREQKREYYLRVKDKIRKYKDFKLNLTYSYILQRCNNKNLKRYKYYGGKGIKCEWKTYEEFKNDMYKSYLEHLKIYGRRNTTIERKDNSKNYCKQNCCWATYKEQANNRSNNKNVL